MKEILKELRKRITKHYGKRCKERNVLCPTCQIWDAYDYIAKSFEFIED